MAYTSVDKPIDYFNTITWTGDIQDSDGTGHDQAITGVGFQPDWVWHKCRSHANQHIWADSIRGQGGSPTQMLGMSSQDSGAETNSNTNGWIESLDSDGYTVTSGNDSSGKASNAGANGRTYVGWCWNCATSFSNNTSATGVGSIDSAGKVNTAAGISIIKYTGAGTGTTTTIAHGLGGVPEMYWVKSLDSVGNFQTYHHKMSDDPKTDYIQIDTTGAVADFTFWGDTAPTSTVFTVKDGNDVNESGEEYLAFLFRSIKGYSKFGTYEGNGNANGSFAYLGFAPAFVMVKPVDAADNWVMFDNTRNNGDPNSALAPYMFYGNTGGAETTDTKHIDFLSNGFKIRSSGNTANRTSTFVYMAFAKDSFVSSGGVPATAR